MCAVTPLSFMAMLQTDVDTSPVKTSRDKFELEPGEQLLEEGTAAILKSNLGAGKWGPLILTDQRLVWQERGWLWPLTQEFKSVPLGDIVHVHQTGLLGLIFGGRRLQITLKSGKRFRIWVGPHEPAAWADRIRWAKSNCY